MIKLLYILFAVLMLQNSFLYSQNYKAINTGKITHFYSPADFKVFSVRIDSIETNADTITLYNYHWIQYIEDNNFTLNGNSWLGGPIIVYPDGKTVFHNNAKEKITINTRANLNESWVMYEQTFSNAHILATVTDIQEVTFLGITDSVKTISMKYIDSTGAERPCNVTDYPFYLSQNYGLTRMFQYSNFNACSCNPYLFYVEDYSDIVGFTDPETGWQNSTAEDIFNFNIGDEFHTEFIQQSGQHLNPIPYIKEQQIRTVTDKSISSNNDTIHYTYNVCYSKISQEWEEETMITSGNFQLTEKIVLSEYSYLNALPYEPVFVNGVLTFFNKTLDKITSFPEYYIPINEETATLYFPDSTSFFEYVIGAGMFYSSTNIYGDSRNKTLKYYKNINTEWGTPLDCNLLLSNSNKNLIEENMNIFPNPATGNNLKIEFKSNNQTEITIINNIGKTMFHQSGNSGLLNINIENWPKGIYLIIISGQGQKTSEKIIIQ